MANHRIVNQRINKLAKKWSVVLTPSLRFDQDFNIHKYYKLDGNLKNRKFFCREAIILGYEPDDEKWTIHLSHAHKAIFETIPCEAERLSKLSELDEPEALEFVMSMIVDNYNFSECFYRIDKIYSAEKDEYIKVYKEFETRKEIVKYLDNYIKNQIRWLASNCTGEENRHRLIELLFNTEWIFSILNVKKDYVKTELF